MATKLVQTESTHLLSKVLDQFVNYICLEKDFFSLLGLDNCLLQLHDPTKKEEEIKLIVDQIANGIASVILSSSNGKNNTSGGFVMPIIVCPSAQGKPARFIAEAVEKTLRNLAQSPLQENQKNETSVDKKKNRPLLIIMDRTVDFTVCLQHQWTYRSMIHDIFQMKSNQVKVPIRKKVSENSSPEQTYEIALDDEFWIENATKPFQEVAQNVTNYLEKHKAKLNEFNKKYGLNMSEEDVMKSSSSTEDSGLNKNTVDEVFVMSQERTRVDMHTNIAYAILHEVNKRKLDEFVAIEEALITKQSKIESAVLHSLLNVSEEGEQEKGTLEDKLRLILVCYLYIIQQERLNQDPQFITRQELEKYALTLQQRRLSQEGQEFKGATNLSLENILPEIAFLKQMTRHISMTRGTNESSLRHNSSLANLTKKFSILGDQIKSIASGLNEYYGEGSEYRTTLPLTRIVDAIVNNTPRKLSEHEEFVFIDPKLPPSQSLIKTYSKSSPETNTNTTPGMRMDEIGQSSHNASNNSQDGFSDVITFVVGGGNYMEYSNLLQHFIAKSGTSINVTYGSTNVLTGGQFLNEIRALGSNK